MSNKMLYWLKLHKDFFSQKHIKKLRKMAGGDTYTIIYLKMQLLSLQNQGRILYDGVEETLEEELALELDEEVENVKMTLLYLQSQRLVEFIQSDEISLSEVEQNILSESKSAERVRKHREKQKALQCNTEVTNGNKSVTTDIDIEIEKEKEIDKENIPPLTPPRGKNDLDQPEVKPPQKQKSKTEIQQSELQLPQPLETKFQEWLSYKREKRQGYKPIGERSLRKQVHNYLRQYPVESICSLIDLSMANNYQGIVWDRLEKSRGQPNRPPSDDIDFLSLAAEMEDE